MAVMDPLPYLFVCLAAYIAATLGLHSIRKKSGLIRKPIGARLPPLWPW
jgi:hypothetical protein